MNDSIISANVLNSQSILALVTLKGWEQFNDGQQVSFWDLIGHIKTLEGSGISVERIGFSCQGDRLYSKDLDSFLTEAEIHGELSYYQLNSIGFTPRLKGVCLAGIKGMAEADPQLWPLVEGAHRALGIRYQTLY